MLKVYQCNDCKKTIIGKETLRLEGWTELLAGSTDAAQEKHVPVVCVNGNSVRVDIGSVAHPMTEAHLIEWVAVETDNGFQVRYLKADGSPVCEFMLADGENVAGVYAFCNLHGLWKA